MVISFVCLAFFVLTEATGYRVNWKTLKLEMSGLISLEGQPRDVKINVNGKNYEGGLPFKLAKILPGQYEVTISRENYSDWSKLYNVAGGQAYEDKKIILYFKSPTVNQVTHYTMERILDDYKNQSSKLIVSNNEIWYKDELVSRFTGSVYSAVLANDKHHIYFQLANEIRVIELDGKNNTKLLELPISSEIVFTLIGDDKIVYIYQDKFYEVLIR